MIYGSPGIVHGLLTAVTIVPYRRVGVLSDCLQPFQPCSGVRERAPAAAPRSPVAEARQRHVARLRLRHVVPVLLRLQGNRYVSCALDHLDTSASLPKRLLSAFFLAAFRRRSCVFYSFLVGLKPVKHDVCLCYTLWPLSLHYDETLR